jgi:hypothetical protein
MVSPAAGAQLTTFLAARSTSPLNVPAASLTMTVTRRGAGWPGRQASTTDLSGSLSSISGKRASSVVLPSALRMLTVSVISSAESPSRG